MRRLLKALHELGAIGVAGALAACLVLVATAPDPADSLAAYAEARRAIAAITQWLLVPSLAAVLVSGLLAIAANRAFHDAGWAWVKALTGISMFEGTLLTVVGSAKQAATISAAAAADAAGPLDTASLDEVLRTEWGGLWIIFALSIANVALGVWRPRLKRQHDGGSP
jgi:hypothetical protein